MKENFEEELICKRIKNLRLNKNMTLDNLAEKVKKTKSYMSKLERSQKAPPISTLYKIATALETDLNFLITGHDIYEKVKVSVVKNNEQLQVSGNYKRRDYIYYSLAYKKNNKLMEPFLVEIAKKTSKLKYYNHGGEEFNYILKGKVEFIIDNDSFVLEEGDSIYFDSKMSHAVRSLEGGRSLFISIKMKDKRV